MPEKLNLKEQLSPEQIQAKFWADFGNGVLNIAQFTAMIAKQGGETNAELAALRTEMQIFNENFRTFLQKAHNIAPDDLDGFGEENGEG